MSFNSVKKKKKESAQVDLRYRDKKAFHFPSNASVAPSKRLSFDINRRHW